MYRKQLKQLFIIITLIVLGSINLIKIEHIDMHALLLMFKVVVPACIVMGVIGFKMEEIINNPKNKAEADYTVSVLNALKKMDKSITLQELNEKLKEQKIEPDANDNDEGLDL